MGRDNKSGFMASNVVPPIPKGVTARVAVKDLLKIYTREKQIREAKENESSSPDDAENVEEAGPLSSKINDFHVKARHMILEDLDHIFGSTNAPSFDPQNSFLLTKSRTLVWSHVWGGRLVCRSKPLPRTLTMRKSWF